MKVHIDRARCIGAGQCVRVAPQVFDQDENEGLVMLVDATPPFDAADKVRKAVILCPAQAILVDEGA